MNALLHLNNKVSWRRKSLSLLPRRFFPKLENTESNFHFGRWLDMYVDVPSEIFHRI
jgi:hypothetical protein